LTTAFVKTKHNPAKLPPATAHPIPCSQIILASSVLENVISIRAKILFSTPFQVPHNRLKKATTAFEG
jgi:hypothetical protein